MIRLYRCNQSKIEMQELINFEQSALEHAIWIDLYHPSLEEEQFIEKYLKIEIPTKEEMHAIELSNRFYKENRSLYMTATMLLATNGRNKIMTDSVTFILTDNKLITLRYVEPQAFVLFASRMNHIELEIENGMAFFMELLEATVDRLADNLENISHALDHISQTIFANQRKKSKNQTLVNKTILKNIGRNGDFESKTRESLISFNRLVSFFDKNVLKPELIFESRLNIIAKDIVALSDHTNFLASQVTFLLNATLGMINIEQTDIIKIFSVVAVIFLPATLIASIYGMNFKYIPELNWILGYPFALFLIILSAVLPILYFKLRKWF